jgi:hypothetical protein
MNFDKFASVCTDLKKHHLLCVHVWTVTDYNPAFASPDRQEQEPCNSLKTKNISF